MESRAKTPRRKVLNRFAPLRLCVRLFDRYVSRMPELAEVEYYRKQWNPGLRAKVLAVELHADKRIFRGTDTAAIKRDLPGTKLVTSEARGKQMAFQFSGGIWIAIHLGMTGKLRTEKPGFVAGKHDHLVLRQKLH